MSSYYLEMDAPDVGDSLSFFAVESAGDACEWQWHYGLTLTSTERFGGSGRCGDGDDFILDEGRVRIDDLDDVDGFLNDFAHGNLPSVPQEVLNEFMDDLTLCEMSDLAGQESNLDFAGLYGIIAERAKDIDPYYDEAEFNESVDRLREYARGHGWDFD